MVMIWSDKTAVATGLKYCLLSKDGRLVNDGGNLNPGAVSLALRVFLGAMVVDESSGAVESGNLRHG